MKKDDLKSKLYDSSLLNEQMKDVKGGVRSGVSMNSYTITGEDTANVSTGNYDITKRTLDRDGKPNDTASGDTGTTTTDQPLP
jgi:hypothetical protein